MECGCLWVQSQGWVRQFPKRHERADGLYLCWEVGLQGKFCPGAHSSSVPCVYSLECIKYTITRMGKKSPVHGPSRSPVLWVMSTGSRAHCVLSSQPLTCVSGTSSFQPQLRNGILLALTLRSFPHLLKAKPWQGPRPEQSKKAGNEKTAIYSPDQRPPRAGRWELAPVDRCDGQRKGKGEAWDESAQSKRAGAKSSDHHWELSVQ